MKESKGGTADDHTVVSSDAKTSRQKPGAKTRVSEAHALQLRGGASALSSSGAKAAAADGVSSGTGDNLPFGSQIQKSFGRHSLGGVRAHVGGAAADATTALGTTAYAFGNDVAFQDSPDLHTAAHEAAHVVQQRSGATVPQGVGRAGDAHEKHADQVADAVVAGQSAESLLDQYDGANRTAIVQGSGGVVVAPEGSEYEGGTGEKPFSEQEITWINQVLSHQILGLLFSSYENLPTLILHRVTAIKSGSKGQFSGKTDEAAFSDKLFEQKESHVGADGKRFEETDEEAFKGTLVHEIFHFLEHNANEAGKGVGVKILPKDIVTVLYRPESGGFDEFAFGWFVNAKTQYINHFSLFNPLYGDDFELPDGRWLSEVKAEGKWEDSPMPKSGNSISAEEDACESLSRCLSTERVREAFKAKYPLRFSLLDKYVKHLADAEKARKKTTP